MPYYAVRSGRKVGVFTSWSECQEAVKGYPKAQFKKFNSQEEAQSYILENVTVPAKRKYSAVGDSKATLNEDPLVSVPGYHSDVAENDPQLNLKLLTFYHVHMYKYGSPDFTPTSYANDPKRVVVYTDGSCKGPPSNRRAGYGVYWGPEHPWNVSERLEGEQTNNRAEIEAAIAAAQQAIAAGIKYLTIVTDSQFTQQCATVWGPRWRKNCWKLSDGDDVKLREPVERLLATTIDSGLDVHWAEHTSEQVFTVETVNTKVFSGQKPGTSGLRKPTKTFMQPGYTENFVQATLNAALGNQLGKKPVRLVLGGDGRYFVRESLERIIIPMCAANGVNEVLVGQNGILSTPATSCIIRKYNLDGGIILTASHNPGGPDRDFGIKFNCENGGPAPEKVTNAIFAETESIKTFKTIKEPMFINLSLLGTTIYKLNNGHTVKVTIISSVIDYAGYVRTLFDFDAIRSLLTGSQGSPGFKILVSGLHGVMGPYIKEVLCNQLGMDVKYALKAEPLEDFGGGHPDPNLTYAADLVQAVIDDQTVQLAAAFDGDGDRNMIIGQNGFFVSPCDSLAVIADNTNAIKYFRENGVNGFARSMPTSRALDKVCEKRQMRCFEVPTGWKFFGNLMDAKLCSVCGEESFGTGSDHIREKDGLWALLSWLSILAARHQAGSAVSVESVMKEHWSKYGRYFFTRYDYEDCESAQGDAIMNRLKGLLQENIAGRTYDSLDGRKFTVKSCDDFSYTDPVDKSFTEHQGYRIIFEDGTRFVFRLSGTGSSGATLRVYVDTYEPDESKHTLPTKVYLRPHIHLALQLCGVIDITGRQAPTVVT